MNSLALLVARILLAYMFVFAGIAKFGDIGGTAGYIGSVGLPIPEVLAWAAAIFETVGGIAILVGFFTRPLSVLFAIFCAVLAFLFHAGAIALPDVPEMVNGMLTAINQGMLAKNLAIAGGFLALSVAGAGAISVDAVRGRA